MRNRDMILITPQQNQFIKTGINAWRYRMMLRYIATRFMKRLYRNTLMGWLWVILRPLIAAVVTTLVLGKIANIPTGGTPYLIFALVSLSLWNLFGSSLRLVTRSLKIGKRFLHDCDFTKILIPMASLIFFLIEFLIYNGLLLISLGYFQIQDGIWYLRGGSRLLLVPLYLLLMLMFTLGIGFVTSVLNTYKRDVQFSVPYLVNLYFFLTPVVYPFAAVPESWKVLMLANPLTALLEGYRWSLLGIGEIWFWHQLYAVMMCTLLFLCGLLFFIKSEPILQDRDWN